MKENIFVKAIMETKEFDGDPGGAKNRFHVALAGTADYIPRLGVTLWSLAKSNPDLPLTFHLFLDAFPEEEMGKLEMASRLLGVRISVHLVNDTVLTPLLDMEMKQDIGRVPAYWYRFLIPDALKGEADRVLYLDGDVLCRADISEMADVDLEGKISAVVRDRGWQTAAARLGTEYFFNSGMMLLNLTQWEKEGFSEKSAEEIRRGITFQREHGYYRGHRKMMFCDQNILNYLCDGKLVLLPKKYNYIYDLTVWPFGKKQTRNDAPYGQAIIHFAGSVKPWRSWVQDDSAVREYMSFQNASPWKDTPLSTPRTHRDFHQAARRAWRQGRWREALSAYGKYFSLKLKRK